MNKLRICYNSLLYGYKSMSDADKKAYMDMVVDLNSQGPAKGIEMSVVKQSVCRCADTGLYRFHLGRYCKCKR